ncbi:Acetophenone carboxylase gamma subunit [Variovorax sp. PBS-H4]|uniref:hydantoinase/oxoprolinase family protein n=1 Tax=Variovorax sp. PBS-H4 TaxID=434008 RepID=UPI001319AAF6|nr:hydantoinase/oxoprolinase family protein [Variovorax sp. PBS-H4]VTU40749.1 Acetophenone carboxylase gamma subunit [Variovorax sp. PBS-H4]
MQQIGFDVGGTFTDLVVTDAKDNIRTLKVLSTPHDYSQGILDGVAQLVSGGVLVPASVERMVHAFTVATNALLTRTGAKVGLITTRGFRDVLEIGRLRMPRLYDMEWDKPVPLVRRSLRLEVRERLSAKGEVVTPLDEDDAARAIDTLVAAGVESIAICLLHAYVDSRHEKRLLEIARARAPQLVISASHQVLPEIREFERTSTTVVNAFVKPVVDRYLGRLERGLEEALVTAPLMIMQSAGGVMKSGTARQLPAYCIESGPAAGAVGAAALGKLLGIANIIAFDMGGTTAKACLIENGEPRLTSELEVGAALNSGQRLLSGGGYVVRTPAIDLAEIGAGGGSLAWIDAGGALRVGPTSAGSVPGPACYGLGGERPTVTDANVVLGFLSRGHLLDGAMPIDSAAAEAAIERHIAQPLGISIHEAAYGIHAVADAAMVRAVQAVTSEIGRAPADFTMVAFGGSGPVHAASLAMHAGIRQIVIPPAPGVFSAFGLLFTRIEHRLVRTCAMDVESADLDRIGSLLHLLGEEADELMRAEGVAPGQSEQMRQLDLRYRGQSSEIAIPLILPLTTASVAAAARAFHEEHERTYGYCSPDEPVQIVNLRLRVRSRSGGVAAVNAQGVKPALAALRLGALGRRQVYFGPRWGWHDTPIVRRQGLSTCQGPLVVEEYDTTVVVPPDARVHLDPTGSIRIDLTPIL